MQHLLYIHLDPVVNNNLTSVKTLQGLEQYSRFYIDGHFLKADSYNCFVKFKPISDRQIIYSRVFYPDSNGEGKFNTGYITVNLNQEQIQVFVDASTYNLTLQGPYRSL